MSTYITKTTGASNKVELHLTCQHKEDLVVTPPPEFNGPENQWSPEDLFCASISSCYLLTFKAMSRALSLKWVTLSVRVEACLEKGENGLKFTDVEIFPELVISSTSNADPYLDLLEKTKTGCLVTKSMNCNFTVHPKIKMQAKKVEA